MNMRAFSKPILGASLTAALVVGCNGGSTNGTPFGGIDGGGFTKGTVTGFGSIIVNGIEFATGSAVFTIDGRAGTQADLRVGDVVTVIGSHDGRTGTATHVTFDDAVEGPVQSVDVAAGTIVVMGQTVLVDGGTSFDDSSGSCQLTDLQPDRIVEVSGFRDSNGDIRATRIECKAAGGEFEVTGTVQSLDTNQRRFEIGSLVVDYSQAQLEDFPGGQPADGQTVEVKGRSFNAGVLVATRVEFEDTSIPGENGERVEIEGLVTRFASVTDFDVSGQRVSTGASTSFEGCGTAPINLPLNAKVEVEGTLSGDTISATEVECKTGTDLRVSATVDAVDAAGNSLTVLGVSITVSTATRFEDQSSAALSLFRLTDVRVGDFVEVRGGAGAAPDSIAAAVLERDDAEAEVELRGIATGVAEPQFTILGVTVRTDAGTQFEDENDLVIPAAEFYARAPNRLVEVDGVVGNGEVLAGEVELED